MIKHWNRAAGVFILGLMVCRAGVAQQPAVPVFPSLKPPPLSHWTIAYQERGPKPTPPPAGSKGTEDLGMDATTGFAINRHVAKEEYELGDSVFCVTKTFTDGTKDQIFLVDKVSFTTDAISDNVRVEKFSSYAGASLRFMEKFPGFEWIKRANFVDEQTINDRKYLHFRQGPVTDKPTAVPGTDVALIFDPNASDKEREAWIDEETKWPFSFRRGNTVGVYHQLSPSEGKIPLPPRIQKAWRIYNGANE